MSRSLPRQRSSIESSVSFMTGALTTGISTWVAHGLHQRLTNWKTRSGRRWRARVQPRVKSEEWDASSQTWSEPVALHSSAAGGRVDGDGNFGESRAAAIVI